MTVKVLYTGPLWKGQSCLSRMEALRDMGHEVIPVDVGAYFHEMPRLIRSLEHRVYIGPATLRYNRALVDVARRYCPHVVWADKGVSVYPSTLRALKNMNSPVLVHYNTDDILCRKHPFSLLRKTLTLYDLHLTTNCWNVEEMNSLGVRNVELTALGYDHRICQPRVYSMEELKPYKTDALFVGHWEEATEAAILAIIEAGIQVRVWGENWHKARHTRRLQGYVMFRPIWLGDYVRALHATKIALGFLSKWNRNTAAMRSFEIPAVGAFLLAERTDEHLQCYEEGVEAEFFGDTTELIEKLRYYIAHDEKRREIARRGYERCLRSGYSYQEQMKRDWRHVGKLVERPAVNRLSNAPSDLS